MTAVSRAVGAVVCAVAFTTGTPAASADHTPTDPPGVHTSSAIVQVTTGTAGPYGRVHEAKSVWVAAYAVGDEIERQLDAANGIVT